MNSKKIGLNFFEPCSIEIIFGAKNFILQFKKPFTFKMNF